jgi:hypothetical protein
MILKKGNESTMVSYPNNHIGIVKDNIILEVNLKENHWLIKDSVILHEGPLSLFHHKLPNWELQDKTEKWIYHLRLISYLFLNRKAKPIWAIFDGLIKDQSQNPIITMEELYELIDIQVKEGLVLGVNNAQGDEEYEIYEEKFPDAEDENQLFRLFQLYLLDHFAPKELKYEISDLPKEKEEQESEDKPLWLETKISPIKKEREKNTQFIIQNAEYSGVITFDKEEKEYTLQYDDLNNGDQGNFHDLYKNYAKTSMLLLNFHPAKFMEVYRCLGEYRDYIPSFYDLGRFGSYIYVIVLSFRDFASIWIKDDCIMAVQVRLDSFQTSRMMIKKGSPNWESEPGRIIEKWLTNLKIYPSIIDKIKQDYPTAPFHNTSFFYSLRFDIWLLLNPRGFDLIKIIDDNPQNNDHVYLVSTNRNWESWVHAEINEHPRRFNYLLMDFLKEYDEKDLNQLSEQINKVKLAQKDFLETSLYYFGDGRQSKKYAILINKVFLVYMNKEELIPFDLRLTDPKGKALHGNKTQKRKMLEDRSFEKTKIEDALSFMENEITELNTLIEESPAGLIIIGKVPRLLRWCLLGFDSPTIQYIELDSDALSYSSGATPLIAFDKLSRMLINIGADGIKKARKYFMLTDVKEKQTEESQWKMQYHDEGVVSFEKEYGIVLTKMGNNKFMVSRNDNLSMKDDLSEYLARDLLEKSEIAEDQIKKAFIYAKQGEYRKEDKIISEKPGQNKLYFDYDKSEAIIRNGKYRMVIEFKEEMEKLNVFIYLIKPDGEEVGIRQLFDNLEVIVFNTKQYNFEYEYIYSAWHSFEQSGSYDSGDEQNPPEEESGDSEGGFQFPQSWDLRYSDKGVVKFFGDSEITLNPRSDKYVIIQRKPFETTDKLNESEARKKLEKYGIPAPQLDKAFFFTKQGEYFIEDTLQSDKPLHNRIYFNKKEGRVIIRNGIYRIELRYDCEIKRDVAIWLIKGNLWITQMTLTREDIIKEFSEKYHFDSEMLLSAYDFIQTEYQSPERERKKEIDPHGLLQEESAKMEWGEQAPPKEQKESEGKLKGMSFCFTGELESMTRMKAQQLVRDNGGIVKSAVSRGLDFLVTNNPFSGSVKNEQAKALGIKVIGEKEFFDLLK